MAVSPSGRLAEPHEPPRLARALCRAPLAADHLAPFIPPRSGGVVRGVPGAIEIDRVIVGTEQIIDRHLAVLK
jgi:hypothetical protein